MRKRLLDFIICPKCKEDFKLEILFEEKGQIKEGLLRCTSCQEIYPIVDFIPRIIKGAIDEYPDFIQKYRQKIKIGKIYSSQLSPVEELNQKTRRSFGYQWTRRIFSRIIPKFEEDFLNFVYPLNKNFFRGKLGLDLGCGFGRHIYYATRLGAEMVGIDFSRAVDSAHNNTKGLVNIHLIQADIYNLPLRGSCFDFIYSIGVLHHLTNPEKGFRTILPLLKSKGHISIWVYSKSRRVVNFVIEPIRFFTKRIPYKILYLICIFLSAIEWFFIIKPYSLLHRISCISSSIEKIIFKRIQIYSEYPFDVLSADWFDRLSAPIRYYYNKDDLRGWFDRANLKLIKISPTGGYGWRALGERQ